MAGKRTYIPHLKTISGWLCRYIQRYQDQLNKNLSAPVQTLLANLLEACIALSDALPVDEPNP